MAYKPSIGDLIEISSKWHPGETKIGIVVKINKSREYNGTIDAKLVFEDDTVAKYIFTGDVKLLSKSS